MKLRHLLLVAASSAALTFNLPAWGARGGYRAAPARGAAPAVAPRVMERSSPPQYQPPPAAFSSMPTPSQAQQVVSARLAESRGHHHDHDFDRDRHPFIFVPDFGYYGSPYWYDWYPDDGMATSGYVPTDGGVAANPPLANNNGAPWYVQQPANAPIPQPVAAPDLTQANAQLTQAEADLANARQRVRDSLTARPDYQAAVAQKAAAEERVDILHSSGVSDYGKLLPAAQAALEARQQVTQIEITAMANDPQVTEARTRLDAATANRNALQAQAG